MTVKEKAIDSPHGQYVVAGIDMSDLFPAPFPDDVKTVHLETLSLAKLLKYDEEELRRIYENCKSPGFFQLDLTDDEQGIQLLRDAVDCARMVRQLLPNMTVEKKRTYKQHARVGVYSKGYGLALHGFSRASSLTWSRYQAFDILPNGQPKYNETINVSISINPSLHPSTVSHSSILVSNDGNAWLQ
jgi:hypothetical protein